MCKKNVQKQIFFRGKMAHQTLCVGLNLLDAMHGIAGSLILFISFLRELQFMSYEVTDRFSKLSASLLFT